MTKSSRQAAIAGYLKRDDGIDWKGLTDYANSMYDVRDELEIAEVEDNFDSETAQKAIKSKTPYLTLRPLQINPAEFRKDLQKLQDAFIEKGVINVDEQVAKLKALDWNKLTDATIKLAGEDPTAFYEVATKEVLGEEADEDMMAVIAGLLLNVLRRYFQNLGEDMTHELSKVDEAKSGDAPLGCPTCGAPAAISSVSEGTEGNSNNRYLFCSCCGTQWPFERIRCALCGNTNSNKLKYVYADEVPAHRMHVCEDCGGAMATVFQDALKGPMDYDIELITTGVILSMYEDSLENEDKQ